MQFKKRYVLRGALVLLCLFFICLAGFVAKQYYHLKIENFSARNDQTNSYYIDSRMSVDQVLDMMGQDYYIGSRQDFKLHAKLMHFHYAEPGFYTFKSVISNRELIDRLRLGRQTPIKMTWDNSIRTREQLAGAVSSYLRMDSVTLLHYLEDNTFLASYGLDKETSRCLFIPNTYQVYWTMTPEQLFDRMKYEFNTFWNTDRMNKAQQIGLSPVEVSILASIVEGESRKKSDQDTIASLYINRIHKGMLLQADPTVKYANGITDARRILKTHLAYDSPYNTYLYRGLPPGPIKCPNAQTLDVVLNAPKTNYLYMCANPDFTLTHVFNVTYAGHQRVADAYRQELNKRHVK